MSPRQAALALVCALALCTTVVCGPALAREEYRTVLDGKAGIFPGAEFKKIFRFPKATVVMFETGEPPAAVAAFYKKDLTSRGWRVQVHDAGKKTAYLLVKKNGRTCIVEAMRGLPGRTGFSISL